MTLSLSYYNQQIIAIKKNKKQNQNKKYKCNSERMDQDARGKKSKHTLYCQKFGRGSTAMELQL